LNLNGGTSTISTIGGSGALYLDGTATLDVTSALSQGSVVSNGTLNISGGTANIVGIGDGVGTGAGGLATAGGIDGTGSLSVSSGAILYAAHIRQATLNIDSTSMVVISDSANPGETAATSVLTDLNNSGTLDITNNSLVITDSTQFSTVRTAIKHAYDAGAWDLSGITSSSAQANTGVYAIGYATATETGTTTFDGQSVSGGMVLVKYTLLGDTKLRGVVDGADLDTVESNFDSTSADWSQGNFYYKTSGNEVNASDYFAVIDNFDSTASGNIAKARPALKATRYSSALSSAAGSANDIVLNVNTITGDISMQATTTMGLTLYNIVDASKTLVKTAALLISKTSTNWQVIKNTSSILAEGQNSTTYNSTSPSSFDTIQLTAGQSIDLGDVFNVTSGVKDLTFEFSEPNANGGDPTTGTTYDGAVVNYLPVPEPTTLGMLGLGGIAMMRRRRRTAKA
jgi:hypothetical protein